MEKNKKEQEIIDFIVERYGEYVLLKPKFDKKNLFLWLFPFIIFKKAVLLSSKLKFLPVEIVFINCSELFIIV